MLLLSRKVNEEVVIGRDVRVRLLKVGRGRVRVGIVAPRRVEIRRGELPSAAPAGDAAGDRSARR